MDALFIHLLINSFFNFTASLAAEIPNLSQRRGSDFMFRERLSLRRDSSRDSISGMKTPMSHPITARSLSLQAPPVMEKNPLARRARSTKRREGKTHSLICFSSEGKCLEDLMWERLLILPCDFSIFNIFVIAFFKKCSLNHWKH